MFNMNEWMNEWCFNNVCIGCNEKLCRTCFKKNSLLHILSKIFWTTICYIQQFLLTPQTSDDLLFLVIDHKLCYLCTRNFKNDLLTRFTPTFRIFIHTSFIFSQFIIHHCKSSHSSLHIFVHHCTFCASLHVKTSPLRSRYVKRSNGKALALARQCPADLN